MQKIGIMGGTFNPIHNGHISIAEKACEQFGLDKVIFMTAGKIPHKHDPGILNPRLRHKMVYLAIKDIDKFELSDYEINKETTCYTYETLQYLQNKYKDADLYLIIGGDSFHDMNTWMRPRTIMEMCTLLIYERSGYNLAEDIELLKKDHYFRAGVIEAPGIDISSTMIRRMIASGEDVSPYIPKKIYNFIKRNGLYYPDPGNFKTRIEKRLKHNRFMHSIGVSIKAEELAKLYGVDTDKAKVAAILHDCAKNIPLDKMYLKCRDYDVILDPFEKKNPALIHAKLGAKVAEYEFGVNDSEVLDAIRWHTIGRVGMTNLEKIIYVADMLEPGRKFKGIRYLKKIASQDLNKAVLECTKYTIEYNKEKNVDIHPGAYELMEWLKTQPPFPPVDAKA